MSSLIGDLAAEGPVLTDGAWGTELRARGLEAGRPPDLWNLSHPDRVEAVARSYVGAGSRVILTNTFRANRIALAQYAGAAETVRAINRAGVEISRRAAEGKAYVFASMGPTGKRLGTGEVTEVELAAAFDEQARALAEAGADAIAVETMTDLTEAGLALCAARANGLPAVACMVFGCEGDQVRTAMGVTPARAARELTGRGAEAIGANCGSGIGEFAAVCAGLAAATERPIWVKPNAGLPEMEHGEAVYRISPDEFAGHLDLLVEAGARFVGGCCGTTPAFIAALRQRMGRSPHTGARPDAAGTR